MAVRNILKFFTAYVKTNLQSAMEYRMSFIVRSAGMFVNDIAWIIFWMIFFAKFPAVNGWAFNDILMMYSIITIGFGLAMFIFGNLRYMPEIIIKGNLDYYLALPKPPLLHMLVSRSDFSGLGDILFGILLLFIAVPLTFQSLTLFLILLIMSFLILLHLAVISGSLTFFIGGSGKMQDTVLFSIVTFGSYPFSAFEGIAKAILLTAIPVGFITGIPVEIMKSFNPVLMLYMLVATVVIIAIAHIIFRIGLKRYESGNLINVRV